MAARRRYKAYTFTPSSGRLKFDVDDTGAGNPYGFGLDGVEMFPTNQLSSWATLTVNSVNIYWVRVRSTASVTTAPTVKRIQMRALNAYATTKEVFEFLQLQGVYSTPGSSITDFTSSTIPTKKSVQTYIAGAKS